VVCDFDRLEAALDLKKEKRLLQGRSKKVFGTHDPDRVIFVFHDDATPFETKQSVAIKNRKKLACDVSAVLFKYVASYHIATHFVESKEPGEMTVQRLDMIPAEFLIWNVATGSLCKRYGIAEGTDLNYPVLECYRKDEKLKYPLLTMDHLHAFGHATPDETATIDRLVRKINAVLKSYFERRHLKLISVRLEFGRKGDQIVLADEMTPETCILWDSSETDQPAKAKFKWTDEDGDAMYAQLCERILA
jgi:phosphoribosylaminoimidazole-succinocarboxamide synthase